MRHLDHSVNYPSDIAELKKMYIKIKDDYSAGTITQEAYEKKKSEYAAHRKVFAGENFNLKQIPRENIKKFEALENISRNDSAPTPHAVKPDDNNRTGGFRKSTDGRQENLPEQLAAMEKRLVRLDSYASELRSDMKKVLRFIQQQSVQSISF